MFWHSTTSHHHSSITSNSQLVHECMSCDHHVIVFEMNDQILLLQQQLNSYRQPIGGFLNDDGVFTGFVISDTGYQALMDSAVSTRMHHKTVTCYNDVFL